MNLPITNFERLAVTVGTSVVYFGLTMLSGSLFPQKMLDAHKMFCDTLDTLRTQHKDMPFQDFKVMALNNPAVKKAGELYKKAMHAPNSRADYDLALSTAIRIAGPSFFALASGFLARVIVKKIADRFQSTSQHSKNIAEVAGAIFTFSTTLYFTKKIPLSLINVSVLVGTP